MRTKFCWKQITMGDQSLDWMILLIGVSSRNVLQKCKPNYIVPE